MRSIEENKLRLENTEFSLVTIIKESVSMVSIQAEKKNIPIQLNLSNELPLTVSGDPIRLRKLYP